MIFLTATTESLTLDTAAALSLDWSAGYVDIDTTTGATPGSDQGNVTTATTTTVVAAPGASVQRQLKSFTAVNKDASLTQTVTLNKVTGAGTFALARNVALAPNETLLWVDSIGFVILDAFGVHKVANTLVNLSTGVTGTLPAQYGGTGQSSYTVGDLLYASGATALSKLADVATGNVLLSGGVATAPAWGKVALTTHVSGILPVANGGTGLASGTDGGILGYTASGTLASSGLLTANALLLGGGAGATPSALGSLGTTTTVLHGNVAGAPSFSAVSLTADVSGTLPVANGGTGITSFGTGVATWLGTPSSANLRAAVTDETGTGALVFADTPTLVTPVLGAATGTSVNLTSTATATAFIPTGSTIPANGMYLSAANTLDFSTASTKRVEISSTGDMGVGVAPTAGRLHISTATAGQTVAYLANSGSTTTFIAFNATNNADSDLQVQVSGAGAATKFTSFGPSTATPLLFNTGGTEKMRIDSSGNVGIGVSPFGGNNRLSVKVGTNQLFTVGDDASQTTLTAHTDAGSSTALRVSGLPLTLSGSGGAGAEHVRVTSAGNVGVGVTAPNSKLHSVTTSSGAATSPFAVGNHADATGTATGIDFITHSSGTLPTGKVANIVVGSDNYALTFHTYAGGLTERLRIAGTGGHVSPGVNNAQDLGLTGTRWATTYTTTLNINSTTMLTANTALTNGAAAATGTLTNAPAAGNPTKWVPINDAGTTRYIPAW